MHGCMRTPIWDQFSALHYPEMETVLKEANVGGVSTSEQFCSTHMQQRLSN